MYFIHWVCREIFYVRNHLPVPDLDVSADNYAVELALSPSQDSANVVTLNLDQLKTKFQQYSVTASLQCAGNRRSEMNQVSFSFLIVICNKLCNFKYFTGESSKRIAVDSGGNGQRYVDGPSSQGRFIRRWIANTTRPN